MGRLGLLAACRRLPLKNPEAALASMLDIVIGSTVKISNEDDEERQEWKEVRVRLLES